jgi:GNAT superfamily N-acetyltransferase
LNSENANRVFILIGDGQIVASCAYTLFNIPSFAEAESTNSRIAGISLVITHPNYRGRGFSKRLMFECEEQARSEGAFLSLLWSDLYDFYSKLGYCLGGQELQWNITDTQKEILIPYKTTRNLDEIQSLYPDQSIFPKRDWTQYKKFTELKNFEIIVPQPNGLTNAYIMIGKGRDLKNCIHEFGGDPQQIIQLIRSYQYTERQKLAL